MTEKRPRLFLIDGYSNIFRAFYAIRSLSNSKGEPTNAVYGFLQMLRKLLKDETPDLVGVALDVGGRTVRDEKYEEYKANRAPMPEDLRPQIPWIRRVIEAHRIPILELERYEADDVLGTLAQRAAEAGCDVTLVSADKDLLQLVDERVSLFHTGRGKLYGPEAVEEDFGVRPGQIVDVLALKGDAVDNIPGVPGIGDKGARQLIQEHETLEALLEAATEVKRKSYREGLQEHRDLALLSKELVTIHTDLPLEFDQESLRLDEPDTEALVDLYRELEFYSLVEELQHALPAGEPAAPAVELLSREAVESSLAALGREAVMALVGGETIAGLAFAGADDETSFADLRRPGIPEAVAEGLSVWLREKDRRLVGHNLKEVLRLVPGTAASSVELVDTMLLSYVIRPSSRAHSLEELALDRLQAKAAGLGKGELPQPGDGTLLQLAGEQVELCRRLAAVLEKELGEGELARVYSNLEAPLVPVLLGMEERGIGLDTGFLAAMSKEMAGEIGKLEEKIFSLVGDRFNLNSPKQLSEVLFERLGYPVIKKTRKTKSFSTDSDTLQQLAAMGHEVAGHLLRYREISKLKSTYVDALPELVGEDGRLHTRFQQAVAATGRLSSANPNLQNIPVRTEMGQQIRKAFRAADGHLLLVADYSQIELRLLAHIAEEEALIAAFEAGEDIHCATAAAVLGVAPELVTAEQRQAAKTINFGIIYGMSAFGLARNLNISPAEADGFIRAYMERYPRVERYMEETEATAKEKGRVATLYGRVRWLPDIHSKNRNLRENARRMAINARIQGTAADLLKKAMIAVDRRLRAEHPDSRLLLTVHDELVLEVPELEHESVGILVKNEMEGVETLRVPLLVVLGSGPSWYDAKA